MGCMSDVLSGGGRTHTIKFTVHWGIPFELNHSMSWPFDGFGHIGMSDGIEQQESGARAQNQAARQDNGT